jgi:aminoglycoside phosphotransferase (APT) family kinase protein
VSASAPPAAAPIGGLLDERSVVDYLAGRGLLDRATGRAVELAGGVSNAVLAVSDARRSLVVKQALPSLRVASRWDVPTERALTEAEALRYLAAATPGLVPELVDVDLDRHILVTERAPAGWSDWKSQLMSRPATEVDVTIAARLGAVLASWQLTSRPPATLPERVESGQEAFVQLRVDPYFRATAQRVPGVAALLNRLIERTSPARHCLVHGDFSAKNVLCGPSGDLWVIDFEVTHRGHRGFDPAFLLSHLVMKWVYLPASRPTLQQCVKAFVESYLGGLPGHRPEEPWPETIAFLGALLLARVAGKSPVEYLTNEDQETVWQIGHGLLRSGLDDPGSNVATIGRALRRYSS